MHSRDDGFTLLEVLVSLVILGVALGLIIALFGGGLRSVRFTEDYSQALQLAREKMDAGLLGPPEEIDPETSGALNGYHWEKTVRPFRDDEDVKDEDVKKEETARLHEIAVTVRWMDGLKEKAISLEGLELVPQIPQENKNED
ncbi:MAG: prepilin-type N-terminal cleavage/methylation domain-containing protein [Nitrospiria bacterium]